MLLMNFIAGGVAGLIVDLVLFPLDTLKTRMQSEAGFRKSGGFNGVYNGLASVLAGSIPSAAVFFFFYEGFKDFNEARVPGSSNYPLVQVIASVIGAFAACIVRVPVEIVKQRSQVASTSLPTSQSQSTNQKSPSPTNIGSNTTNSSFNVLMHTLNTEGPAGLCRGFFITAIRDSAFSLLEFPIWEQFKLTYMAMFTLTQTPTVTGAMLGAVAGAIAAVSTTPLDVAKTQMMLAEAGSLTTKLTLVQSLKRVYAQNGIQGLFRGAVPRVCWISIGGFIFLGVYDGAVKYFNNQPL